ncbi:hypothetical protein QBD01_004740 [Ochrobactrum sp. 19YEA23]|uniref:glycosyltransferase family 29 protein n=1 Tax=Ochrobactrum sp. 19YEA23 TaxID=3039854 RepID=UPI002479655A|nr:hypothetical protein [Ochrobactrum sp. 19YEA23]
MKKMLTVVGNGPLSRNLSNEIDSSDYVLRFNVPHALDGMTGSRTDLLMLATSAKQMQDWLRDPAFLDSVFMRNASEILFAVHPSIIRRFHHHPNVLSRLKGRRADWTLPAFEILSATGKSIRILPPQVYFEVCAELGIAETQMKQMFPSTGFFGVWHMLRTFPSTDWEIQLCGFSWQGWKHHAWAAERHWIEERASSGQIRLLS